MREHYDAIVVGARSAGSALAISLARRDWDVLVVDRDPFPTTTSRERLARWFDTDQRADTSATAS